MCHPLPSARRVRDGQSIAGLVPAGVQQHIEQHGLYTSTTPGTTRGGRAAGRARQAGCMAKTEKRRKAARASRSRSTRAVRRGRRQEGDRPRRARPAEGGGLHRLLRDLLGQNARQMRAIADAVDGGAGGAQASSRRTSKATTAPSGFCSTTSTSSCTSSRRRRALFYGLERLWGSAERIEVTDDA